MFPYDPTQIEDRDGDGMGDNPMGIGADKFPDDATQWNDIDGDGYLDIDENLQSTDPYSSSATQTALLTSKDTDGDGLTDEFENTFSQTNINLVDTDGDGIDDKFDGYPLDPLRTDLIESKQVWTELPGLKSNLIASGLEVGVYRAKVSDARNYTNPLCGGVFHSLILFLSERVRYLLFCLT